jgi:hypothetical protein
MQMMKVLTQPNLMLYRDARCKSIVAVLTLEVTGIPEVSQEDLDGLVVPSFTSPTAPHSFEVRNMGFIRT